MSANTEEMPDVVPETQPEPASEEGNGVAFLGGTWKRRRTGFEGVCPYTMDCAAGDMMANW